MKSAARAVAIFAGAMGLASLLLPHAAAAGSDSERLNIGPSWMRRIDPWGGIPSSLALRFGRAAVAGGLTPPQAARLLNDARFVAAVGAPDQGWGLLEALVDRPAAIVDAHMLLRAGTEYTLAVPLRSSTRSCRGIRGSAMRTSRILAT